MLPIYHLLPHLLDGEICLSVYFIICHLVCLKKNLNSSHGLSSKNVNTFLDSLQCFRVFGNIPFEAISNTESDVWKHCLKNDMSFLQYYVNVECKQIGIVCQLIGRCMHTHLGVYKCC